MENQQAKGVNMIITDIKPQVKKQNRVSVFIDGKFAFGLDKSDCTFMGLKIGTELTQERYDYIIDNAVYAKAYQKADRYIGFKMRTEKEVRNKLIEEGYSDEITERVIASMLKYKYIDYLSYAIMYAKDCRKLKKWGPERIKAELYKKGVKPEYIENALSESDTEDTEEIIDALLEKRIKNTPIDLKEKQKHINFLLRRGFKYDDIKSVIEKYC